LMSSSGLDDFRLNVLRPLLFQNAMMIKRFLSVPIICPKSTNMQKKTVNSV